nr:dr1-associated corepressor isoform X3 [Misgurnus anguillicaudatus]
MFAFHPDASRKSCRRIQRLDESLQLYRLSYSRNSRVMSINHMKQCIHSEKLFDFLKDLADQASAASTSESKTKGKWQSHRKRWQSVPFKARSPEREKLPEKSTNDRVINSDSSSESELFICLETHSP